MTEDTSNRILFDADSRGFVLQSGDVFEDYGSAPIGGWRAEGLDAEQVLDLKSLMSQSDVLNDDDAERLEVYTSGGLVTLGYQDPPDSEAIIIPDVDGPTGTGLGDPSQRDPVCPDGTELPGFCKGHVGTGSRVCSCD